MRTTKYTEHDLSGDAELNAKKIRRASYNLAGDRVDMHMTAPFMPRKESAGDARLPIRAGVIEASAIPVELQRILTARPSTHGVMTNFFFSSRRRHTRCLSDWSSDVCSSDLADREVAEQRAGASRLDEAVGLEHPRREGRVGAQQRGAGEQVAGAEDAERERAGHVDRSEERRVGKEGRAR